MKMKCTEEKEYATVWIVYETKRSIHNMGISQKCEARRVLDSEVSIHMKLQKRGNRYTMESKSVIDRLEGWAAYDAWGILRLRGMVFIVCDCGNGY